MGLWLGNTWGAMVGHGLTCGSVAGEHNARTWDDLWVYDRGTLEVQC